METRNLTCIGCPLGCAITVTIDDETINITGNTCKRGADYAAKEVTHPTRIVTSTVCVEGGSIPMVSVKTEHDIPKEKIMEVMDSINDRCCRNRSKCNRNKRSWVINKSIYKRGASKNEAPRYIG